MSGSHRPKFARNDHVRVKRGVTDFDYADMPLGGWRGTVVEVEEGDSTTYLVRWSPETLAAIMPLYRRRCEQDGLDYQEKWLEEDDLEMGDRRPLAVEKSKGIATPILSAENEEDRIRAVFGMAGDEPLPNVDQDALLTYYEHLCIHLTFPFLADLQQTRPAQPVLRSVTVLGLAEKSRVNDVEGILCRVVDEIGQRDLPLTDLRVDPDRPNDQPLSDYTHWFCNLRKA